MATPEIPRGIQPRRRNIASFLSGLSTPPTSPSPTPVSPSLLPLGSASPAPSTSLDLVVTPSSSTDSFKSFENSGAVGLFFSDTDSILEAPADPSPTMPALIPTRKPASSKKDRSKKSRAHSKKSSKGSSVTPLSQIHASSPHATTSSPSLLLASTSSSSLSLPSLDSPTEPALSPSQPRREPSRPLLASPPSSHPVFSAAASPDFEEPDADDNITFMSTAKTRPDVKAGTLTKLVERLTFSQYSDPNFMKQFMLTYRSFTDPESLLRLLYQRYAWQPAADAQEYLAAKQPAVRIRVCNVLKYWVNNHFSDFQDLPLLEDRLHPFLAEMCAQPAFEKLARNIAKELERKKEEDLAAAASAQLPATLAAAPKPILPKTGQVQRVLDLSAQELARQLTIFEQELFRRVRSSELLGQAWSKKKEAAPNILAMIHWSNRVIKWAATLVVTETDFKKRVATLKLLIDTAVQCRLLNNCNGVMEILSGLNLSACFRLKKTWRALGRTYLSHFEELGALVHPDRNFSNMRQFLESIAPPAIPYMGMFLTDLTFIDENSDFTASGLINFDKRRQIATVIESLLAYQRDRYNLVKVPFIQEFLKTDRVLSEKDQYNHSLAREQRSGQAGPDTVVLADSDEEDFGALEDIPDYPFGPDLPGKNVVFSAGKELVSATFTKLLEHATPAKFRNLNEHVDIALTTYRLFCSSSDLVRLLRHRFFLPRPLHATQELMKQFELKRGSKIRTATVAFIKSWVKCYPNDLATDAPIRTELISFLNVVSVADESLGKACSSVLALLTDFPTIPQLSPISLFALSSLSSSSSSSLDSISSNPESNLDSSLNSPMTHSSLNSNSISPPNSPLKSTCALSNSTSSLPNSPSSRISSPLQSCSSSFSASSLSATVSATVTTTSTVTADSTYTDFSKIPVLEIIDHLHDLAFPYFRTLSAADLWRDSPHRQHLLALSNEIHHWILAELVLSRPPLSTYDTLAHAVSLCLEAVNKKNFFVAAPVWQALSSVSPTFSPAFPLLPQPLQRALQDFPFIFDDANWATHWNQAPGSGLPPLALLISSVRQIVDADLPQKPSMTDLLPFASMQALYRLIFSAFEHQQEDPGEPSASPALQAYLQTVVILDADRLAQSLQSVQLPKAEDLPHENQEQLVPETLEASELEEEAIPSSQDRARSSNNSGPMSLAKGFNMLVRKGGVESKSTKPKNKGNDELLQQLCQYITHLEEQQEKLQNQNKQLRAQNAALFQLFQPIATQLGLTLPSTLE